MAVQDDVLYFKILVFSFCCSYFVKRVPCRFRADVCAALGLLSVYVVCGGQIFYSLTIVLVNLAIVKLSPTTPVLNFISSFVYLAFFRFAHLLCGGEIFPKYSSHANAVQLLVTLRCIGVAFELSDQRRQAKEQGRGDDEVLGLSSDPIAVFFYCYNVFGLFTGPYFTYRVHSDMVRCDYLQLIPFAGEVIHRFVIIPLLVVVFLSLQAVCPYEGAAADSFYETNSFLARLLYSAPVFAVCRFRFYIAWMLSEAACIAVGLGAYPKVGKPKVGSGPSDVAKYEEIVKLYAQPRTEENIQLLSKIEYDYETVRNADMYGCEFGYTFRELMKSWNRSVQYWLAAYIYQRWPLKATRTTVTLLLSAYWHGFHAGYYLSFLAMPICMIAEELIFSLVDKMDNAEKKATARRIWWFFRVRGSDYFIMGFLLLSWRNVIRYWSSVYFIVHILLLLIIGSCWMIKMVFVPRHSSTATKPKQ